jgi:hypothetical protein
MANNTVDEPVVEKTARIANLNIRFRKKVSLETQVLQSSSGSCTRAMIFRIARNAVFYRFRYLRYVFQEHLFQPKYQVIEHSVIDSKQKRGHSSGLKKHLCKSS